MPNAPDRVDLVAQRLGIETERRGRVEIDRRFSRVVQQADHRVGAARRLFRAESRERRRRQRRRDRHDEQHHRQLPQREAGAPLQSRVRAFVGVDIT